MSEQKKLDVLCVGAGLASLSVAIALRPHVATVTVLEAAESPESMNVRAAGLNLYPPAAHVLRDTLGLDPERDLSSVSAHSMKRWNWLSGNIDLELEIERALNMTYRGALLDGLLKKATGEDGPGRPVKVEFGKQVVEVDPDTGKVVTSDGTTYRSSLIVGGDGVRSVVRQSITSTSIVSPSGLSVYRWTLSPRDWSHLPASTRNAIDALIGPEARVNNAVDTTDMRLVLYRCHSNGTVNGALLLPDYRLPSTSENWAAAGSVTHLREVTKDLAEPFASIVGCVTSCGLWQLRKQAPLQRWARGRAIALGDAAHPMLPFQAMAGALCLEDAEALLVALREVEFREQDVPRALERVFCLRFLRCSLIQHFSNASPFGSEVMERAESWAVQRAKEGANGPTAVPVVKRREGDPVQRLVQENVEKHASAFDPKSTSKWVVEYFGAEWWEREQQEFVLDKPFE